MVIGEVTCPDDLRFRGESGFSSSRKVFEVQVLVFLIPRLNSRTTLGRQSEELRAKHLF